MNTMFKYTFKVAYLVAIYILLSTFTFAQDNWTWLNPKPMGYSIFASTIVPANNTVFAVGDKGVIVKSSDNGSSWELVRWDTNQILRSIHFPSSTVGYACGDNSIVLKTTNGGASWATITAPSIPGDFMQLHFITDNTGFLLDSENHILHKTTDGSSSWTTFLSSGAYGTFTSFQMIDEDDGWIGTGNGTILKIVSGEYTSYTVRDFSLINHFCFYDALNGVALTGGAGYYSTDGGITWVLAAENFLFNPNMVAYASAMRVTAVAASGAIGISTDGGRNWTISISGVSNLKSILFFDDQNGLINGENGALHQTNNGGLTWTNPSTLATDQQLNSTVFTSQTTGYVAGASGKIFKTTDGGANWTAQTTNTTETIHKIYFRTALNGYAVSSSKLLKTGNGGTNWSSTNVAYTFQDIHFKDASFGIACGASTSKVATTSSGGTNWTSNSDADLTQDLYALAVLPDAVTVVCVGSAGKVVRSVNYGVNWDDIPSGTTEQLNSVQFLDAAYGWACGNNGTIIKSTDGGLTWSVQNSGTTSHLQSIKFYTRGAGLAVGHNGVILQTEDGGTNWAQYETIAPFYLNEVAILSSSQAVVVGAGGTILKGNDLPLPVELTSFTATHKNGTVTLNWETKTEIDNYGFDIERKSSTTGWQKIGFVEGHFTTNSPKYYNFTDRPKGAGKLRYRLKQIDNDGTFEYSPVAEVLVGNLPNGYLLEQNYPNPFNPSTTIGFTTQTTGFVKLVVYNPLGEAVKVLFSDIAEAGRYYKLEFDATGLTSGVYFYQLEAENFKSPKKMTLIK